MRAFHKPGANQLAHGILHRQLAFDIEPRRQPFLAAMTDFQEMARAHFVADLADENDRVAFRFEKLRRDVRLVINQSHHRHGRRRIDHARRALII